MANFAGAVDSILGRLTSVLVEEATLLGSVRGEIQFIRDEMESMNGFLMHLTEATGDGGDPNHQVQAWMTQVRYLAYDSQDCVHKYMQCLGPRRNGVLGFIRRIPRLVWTLPTRHRVAMRIRELKVRARDVGERRLRYGVAVPDDKTSQAEQTKAGAPLDDGKELQDDDDRRRRALHNVEAELFGHERFTWDESLRASTDEMIRSLTEEAPDEAQRQLRVIPIVGWEYRDGCSIANEVFEHPSLGSLFPYKARVANLIDRPTNWVLSRILEQVLSPEEMNSREHQRWEHKHAQEELKKELKEHLRGKKFLIILENPHEYLWRELESALRAAADCAARSAVILATTDYMMAGSCSPYKILYCFSDADSANHIPSLTEFFVKRADMLLANNHEKDDLLPTIRLILFSSSPDVFAMKIFLRILYTKTYKTKEELLVLAINSEIRPAAERMLTFCYEKLPTHYQRCLLYLTIFPRRHRFRRASLVRRWVVEGLIGRGDRRSALDEAKHCFNELVDRGFLFPLYMIAAGEFKGCEVYDQCFDILSENPRYDNFLDLNMSLQLTRRLYSGNMLDRITELLDSMSPSSQLGLLKVLDLEGCIGLEERHLNNICNKMFLLKYLSLRNTDVTSLPKQINKLRYLEILDIRQTKTQAFPANTALPPLLKHLLVGRTDCSSGDAIRSDESFSTMHIPPGIWSMKQMETLSHVQVSKSANELEDVGWLLQLRKLGIILHAKGGNFKHLLRVIDRLNKSLRSLSIRIEPPPTIDNSPDINIVETIFSPPKFLESLSISGIKSGLPFWIEQLHQLKKITLRETNLTGNDLQILSKLTQLCCLRLRYNSYIEDMLTFKKEEFQNLKFLVVEGANITRIVFEFEAPRKLEQMVWSFTKMEALSGIDDLPSLKVLELHGNCDVNLVISVQRAIERNANSPIFTYHPHEVTA